MAKEDSSVVADKKQLKEEQKKFKQEQKAQKKEAKKKAKELAAQEDELNGDDAPGGIPVFLVTLLIVLIWLAIVCILIKLDVGGVGSGVLAPILRDVPYVNLILPQEKDSRMDFDEDEDLESDAKYKTMKEAMAQIKKLELELEQAQEANLAYEDRISQLQQEVDRLQQFEDAQVDFNRIREEFYEEVVYAENGPGAEEYQKYYENMNPEAAEKIYRQVIQEGSVDKKIQEYASAYAAMKPKDAAAIFDTMTDDFDLVAKILNAMGADDRGKILAQMNEDNAARITKIMEPQTNDN